MSALVLASASPRRNDLLGRLGLAFDVVAPDVDETPGLGEDPVVYVERVARAKATAVAGAGAVVLAADTTVVLDGIILGKPADGTDAARMLSALAGRTHDVLTGVAVRRADGHVESTVVRTAVTMTAMSEAEIAWYVGTGEPLDKAGAYALQGSGAVFVERIEGSASNVVGLPLATVAELLRRAGVEFTRR